MSGSSPGAAKLYAPHTIRTSGWTGDVAILVYLAMATVVVHVLTGGQYGFQRDELATLEDARHLAWGYVAYPPVTPFFGRISLELFGTSLTGFRFFAAIAEAIAVVLTGLMARELGGSRWAQLVAATAAVPFCLAGGALMQYVSFDYLSWVLTAYFTLRLLKSSDPRWWVAIGSSIGLGMLSKYSMPFLVAGLVVGVLATNVRRHLKSRWLWCGVAVSLLIFLPNLIWNLNNHWPFLELMHNIRASGRDVRLSAFEFFTQQVLLLHPLTAPIWITGVFALLLSQRLKKYRMLGWCYLSAFTAFVALKGKNYYLAPIYPMLFAAGAVIVENGIVRTRQAWLKPATIVLLIAGGAWLAPLVVPVFSVDHFISYMNDLPFKVPRSEHSHERALLPQHYADQFGWEEMTAVTAQAWARVPPEERRDCGIFAQDYGQAGAIDFFGPRYGLPPALSGHQTYFLWGPRNYSGNCLIILDDKKEVLDQLFEHVEYVGTSDNPYALERNIPVFLCKGAKFGSLQKLWPKLKKWY